VAAQTSAHARELIARGQFDALDCTVTALTRLLERDVQGVIELQVRSRQ
jgi:hypothetical protein